MTRRAMARLTAVGLLLVVVSLMAVIPAPYVTVSPGPTVDVLGEREGEPVVSVEDARTYPTSGEMRLTTIYVTPVDREISVLRALSAWLSEDDAVLPFRAMYPQTTTAERERTISSAQMVSSQDAAVAAALSSLGYELTSYVELTGITPDGPSDGSLETRDRLVSVAGSPVGDVEELFEVLNQVQPGDKVAVEVLRDRQRRSFTITTQADEEDPDRALLGVLVGTGFELPVDVEFGVDETIGGPSAGLMFALAVYDALTPGALTGGRDVAGTGSIEPDGTVGPIGGIQQKVLGAARTGSELFLVPGGNCEAALETPLETDIALARVDTLADAVRAVEAFAEQRVEDLPRCEAQES